MPFQRSIKSLLLALALSSCDHAPDHTIDEFQTRQYLPREIFTFGGTSPEQRRLFDAYNEAIQQLPRNTSQQFKRAFEKCGVLFPEESHVYFSVTSSHLFIRHKSSVLDQLEARFALTPAPITKAGRTVRDPFRTQTLKSIRYRSLNR
jgi:hypothetical protein